MNAGVAEPEKDLGKVQFQEELNRWFESRGIIADLRSHLRHLMITALQNTKIGLKPTDRTSPKTQALNLIIAEYLLRHKCHYTLSVFTSEVPTLTTFSTLGKGVVLQGWKSKSTETKKMSRDFAFQDKEIEEIFNALGLPFSTELDRLKTVYLQKESENSLIELLLQAVIQMSAKLQIAQSLESNELEEGERLLSKKWSSKVTDILLSENIKPPQVTIIEEGIFRVTESEMRNIIEQNRKSQMKILAERERRIQEYLRRHENEIILRLEEAERELSKRTEIIDEDLAERQRHLYQLVLEWSDKHEEIVKLSKNFYDIEKEKKKLLRTKEELEKENKSLKDLSEKQNDTIYSLQNEISSLITKLKEVTESNAILSERMGALMNRENKEVTSDHDDTKQPNANGSLSDIPLVWSKKKSTGQNNSFESGKGKYEVESGARLQQVMFEERCYNDQSDVKSPEPEEVLQNIPHQNFPEDDNSVSLSPSSSSEEIMLYVRKKLQDLEEESNKISKNYLDYKLKYQTIESESEKSKSSSNKCHIDEGSFVGIAEPFVIKETKFSQTEIDKSVIASKVVEKPRESFELPALSTLPKTPAEMVPVVFVKEPTKRQLLNRDYFLKSRQLLHQFEKQNVEELYSTMPSNIESSSQISTPSSSEELSRGQTKQRKPIVNRSQEKLVLSTPLRTTSFYCNESLEPKKNPSTESILKRSAEGSKNAEMDCLALLEEARIKLPEEHQKVSLRQQILLTDSEDDKSKNEVVVASPRPVKSGSSSSSPSSSGRVSVGKGSGHDDFW